MNVYTVHPLADLIPTMTAEEYDHLKVDIQENGLLDPITLYEERVLDGRHRMRVCQETGVEPRFEVYTGDDPARFVVSKNIARRHLTPSQLAMIAAEMLPHLRVRAKVRQGTRTDLTLGPNGPKVPRRTADEAASLTGASSTNVKRATRVKRDDPELAERVMNGEVNLSAADKVMQQRVRAVEAQQDANAKKAANLKIGANAKTPRWAPAAQERVEKLIGQLESYAMLDDVRIELAATRATPSDLARWRAAIREARRNLMRFEKRIPATQEGADQ